MKSPIAGDNSRAGVGFVGAGTTVYWHLLRSHDRPDQHLLVKSSSALFVREMSFPAAFEVPLHHSPPSAVPSCVPRFQIEHLGIGARNCFPLAREESLVGRVIVLALDLRDDYDSLAGLDVDCLLLEVFAQKHHSEDKS